MAMIKINGANIKDPSSFSWGFYDQSSDESGRSTNDGKMHKDIISSKRILSVSWQNISKDDASAILQLVNSSVFMDVTYPDAMSGTNQTRKFYVGDRSAPVKIWTIGKQIYSSLSFDFIEQ